MMENPSRLSLEHRISSTDIPAFFCRSDAPHVPLIVPWMDMESGDSFEHTERTAHPKAMENIQLRGAYASFTAARARPLSVPEALATLAEHVQCPLTCEGMAQPVRAPDNILYEAQSLLTSLYRWKSISPMTRAPFPPTMTLVVDRRMQQLSAACGTAIAEEKRLMAYLQVSAPRFAPTLEAAEAGEQPPASTPCRWAAVARVAVNMGEGVVTGAVLQAFNAPTPLSCMGGFLMFVGCTVTTHNVPLRLWLTQRAL